MRWVYAFFLLLGAWAGFVQVALKDEPPQWRTWEQPR
jgi:hypothetical protein